MDILLTILIIPLVFAVGVGLLRLMVSPAFWFTVIPFGVAMLLMFAHG